MSSLASVMLIVGTAAIGDIWNVFKPMKPASVVRATKWAIVAYSFIVFACTVYPPAGIVELTSFSGAVFAASFFPAIFGGLYLRWGTGHGAFWSMLIGMVTCVSWRFLFRFEYEALRDVHEIIPSFLISLVAFIVISKLTASKAPDEQHLKLVFG
jgi:Na+/proline symporter